VHHLVTDLDASTVRASTPRALTQEISSYVAVHRDEQGRPYAGIRYQSKLGDEIINWAIFETDSLQVRGCNPVTPRDEEPIAPDDEDLRRALGILGLTLED